MRTLTWQATLLLLAIVGGVTTAFLLVFYRDGIGSAIATVAIFGVVTAVIAGVIVWQLRLNDRIADLQRELTAQRAAVTISNDAKEIASKKVEAVLAHADPALIETLKKSHPTLFAP